MSKRYRKRSGPRGDGRGRATRARLVDPIAIFAVDPGGTTGFFHAVVDLEAKTMKEAMTTLQLAGRGTTTGSYREQGRELAKALASFQLDCQKIGVGLDKVRVTIEDFVLRRRTEGGATGNLTSCWVAAAFVGAADAYIGEPTFRQASQAKSFATDERLKLWTLYRLSLKPASPHVRDAIRHFALEVNKQLP